MLGLIDDRICAFAQETYCYLLDRFGLRLGDVICLLTIAQIATPRPLAGYVAALVCLAIGCWVSGLQRAGRHGQINRAADFLRGLLPLRLGAAGFAVYHVTMSGHAIFDEALNVALVYVLTCKVRKRDDDRFRKTRLAEARA